MVATNLLTLNFCLLVATQFALQTGLAVRLHRFHKITGYVLTDEKLPKHYPTKHGGLLNLREMDEKKITDPYHCSALFGYLDELPGIPYFFKDARFKSAFTVYTPYTPKDGLRIGMRETKVLQLRHDDDDDFDLEEFIESQDLDSPYVDPRRAKEVLNDRIVKEEDFPFDLHRLQRTRFDPTQVTRVVIPGYRSTEDADWMNEIVDLWRELDPKSNIIKFSWDKGNHDLFYLSAAYNSRLAGRHLSVFIYYLDQLFGIDKNKFHLVGHSLGAQIAAVVGGDNGGKMARITGLDPAGPIFQNVPARHRLDPSDAKFVDVIHTNAGLSFRKGSLGIEEPVGHVDIYVNGGWVQPGCSTYIFGREIPNPICSHCRSHEFFRELLRMAIDKRDNKALGENRQWPKAYLIDRQDGEILRKSLRQPNVLALRYEDVPNYLVPAKYPPLKFDLDPIELHPSFPKGKHGLYVFGTRSLAPYFASSNQYVFNLRTTKVYGRRVKMVVAARGVILFERLITLSGSQSIVFVPNDESIMKELFTPQEGNRATPLSFWWWAVDMNIFPMFWLGFESIEIRALERDLDGRKLPVLTYDSAMVTPKTNRKRNPKKQTAKTTNKLNPDHPVTKDKKVNLANEQESKIEVTTEAPRSIAKAIPGFQKDYVPAKDSVLGPVVWTFERTWYYLNGRITTN